MIVVWFSIGQHSGTVSYLPAANGTAAPASDMSHSTAVSEVRQQGLEVRLSLDRINEKIDRAHEKVLVDFHILLIMLLLPL